MYELFANLGLDIPEAVESFEPRTVNATITAVGPDSATVRFVEDGRMTSGLLPITEAIRSQPWETGATLTLMQAEPNGPGRKPLMSAVRPGLIEAIMCGHVPEVRDGRIRVMGVARRPGGRVKVAVASTSETLDAVAACVGRRHNRVDAIRNALGGEQVDIVAWHPDPLVYLRNALQPAQVKDVKIDAATRTAVAYAEQHQMAAAVGGGGLNSFLAGRLVGVSLRIV